MSTSISEHARQQEDMTRGDVLIAGLREEVVSLRSATAAKERERENAMERKHFADSLESDSPVGSCQCLTKTPDPQFHAPGCKYRLISERDALQARVRELEGKLEFSEKEIQYYINYSQQDEP